MAHTRTWYFRLAGAFGYAHQQLRVRIESDNSPHTVGRGMWLEVYPAELDGLIARLTQYRARFTPHEFVAAPRALYCLTCDARQEDAEHV